MKRVEILPVNKFTVLFFIAIAIASNFAQEGVESQPASNNNGGGSGKPKIMQLLQGFMGQGGNKQGGEIPAEKIQSLIKIFTGGMMGGYGRKRRSLSTTDLKEASKTAEKKADEASTKEETETTVAPETYKPQRKKRMTYYKSSLYINQP
ncbi:hypothetical protein PVAND_016153 [Polypedilum vanderplanki]|uniref:Uncharacterized protein n=1 Tax=Polypedilum vanderplanki TaxID=319348 RepID=A0A9J6BEA2_POLVA|nr:hypothetical protein PVAND_016153 [Polypedilum vanderplanki]